jgi:hypothetical protein
VFLTEEDGIEFAIVFKEDPETLWNGKDCVAMGNVLNHFSMDVFRELHCPLSSARRTHPSTLAGEGDKERVFASITIRPRGTVRQDAAVKVLLIGFQYLVT